MTQEFTGMHVDPNDERQLRMWAVELCGGHVGRAAEVVQFVIGATEKATGHFTGTLKEYVAEKRALGWKAPRIAQEYVAATGGNATAHTVRRYAWQLGLTKPNQAPHVLQANLAAARKALAARRNAAAHT